MGRHIGYRPSKMVQMTGNVYVEDCEAVARDGVRLRIRGVARIRVGCLKHRDKIELDVAPAALNDMLVRAGP